MGLPHEDTLICPRCKVQFRYQWFDSETQIKLTQKELGLVDSDEILKKIDQMEKKIAILEKSHEVEGKRRELVESEVSVIKTWSKKREKDFLEIEQLAEELKDNDQFQKDHI